MSESWESEAARKWREKHPLKEMVRAGQFDLSNLEYYESEDLIAVQAELERALPKEEYGDGYFVATQTIILGKAVTVEAQLAIRLLARISAELRARDPLGIIDRRVGEYKKLSLDTLAECGLHPDQHVALYWRDNVGWFGVSQARLEKIQRANNIASERYQDQYPSWIAAKSWRDPLPYREYLRRFCEPNTVLHEALTLFFAAESLVSALNNRNDEDPINIATFAALAGEKFTELRWRLFAETDAMRGRDEAATRKARLNDAKANKGDERSAILINALEQDYDQRATFINVDDLKHRAKILKKLADKHDESAEKPLFVRNSRPFQPTRFGKIVSQWEKGGVISELEEFHQKHKVTE